MRPVVSRVARALPVGACALATLLLSGCVEHHYHCPPSEASSGSSVVFYGPPASASHGYIYHHHDHDVTLVFDGDWGGYWVRDYPEQYAYNKIKEFTVGAITQPNRNLLLWRDASVDGIKTGHHSAAGYCLMSSAKRGDQRLIAVVMGSTSEKQRADDSLALLNWGFRFYETHRLYEPGKAIATQRVWKGKAKEVQLGVAQPMLVSVPRGRYDDHLVSVLDRVGGAGHQRRLRAGGDVAGGDLVAEVADGLRAGPNPDQVGVEDRLGEVGVLRQEAVAGVDGVGAGLRGGVEDLAEVQVGLGGGLTAQGERLVGQPHVWCVGVGLGVHRHAGQARIAGRRPEAGHRRRDRMCRRRRRIRSHRSRQAAI